MIRPSGFGTKAHLGRELAQVLEVLPRDDLFQTPVDELFSTALAIVPSGAQQDRVFPAQGPLRSLLLLPGLRAARRVFHRDAPEDPPGPDGAPAGERLRVLDLLLQSVLAACSSSSASTEVAHRPPTRRAWESDPGLPILAGRLQRW